MKNKLIIFSASWCRPCKRLKRNLSDSNLTYDDYVVVDFDVSKDLVHDLRVDVIPTIVVTNYKGQEIKRVLGVKSATELEQLLNE